MRGTRCGYSSVMIFVPPNNPRVRARNDARGRVARPQVQRNCGPVQKEKLRVWKRILECGAHKKENEI